MKSEIAASAVFAPALAAYLGVSERRIKTLREHGLPARKIGRELYFDVDEVEDFIDCEGSRAFNPTDDRVPARQRDPARDDPRE